MAKLEIRIYPDPVLKEVAEEHTSFDKDLHRLLEDMKETMYESDGIGLAAPQIGVSTRVAVVDVSNERSSPIELINPIITASEGSVTSEEGCLSIPKYRETISRFERISVKALDRHGKSFELDADGLLAICMQHEIDHLEGILFIDHLSRLKREFFRRWLRKQQKDSGA